MANACKNHYELLHAASASILIESFTGIHADSMAKSHAFIEDIVLWIEALGTRSEVVVIQAALKEYQFALLAVALGHYRAAFSALRLALELSFAAVQWSANERELREWNQGKRDSNWATLIDHENGILSKQFVRLFSEELADETGGYRSSAGAVYRECSEYVHGNAHTHLSLPRQLVFDAVSFTAWQQKVSVVQLTISFAFTARYLKDLSLAERSKLEHMLIDRLGHSAGVRALVGASTEVSNG